MKAAAEVFSRDGFHLAKVEDIATTAGVGKGTVYEYFNSKAQLFQKIFEESCMDLLEGIALIKGKQISPTQQLESLAKLLVDHMVQSKDLSRVAMDMANGANKDFLIWMRGVQFKKIHLIQEIVEEGIATGCFRNVNSLTAAMMFTGAISAIYVPLTFDNVDFDYDAFISDAMDMVLQGLLIE